MQAVLSVSMGQLAQQSLVLPVLDVYHRDVTIPLVPIPGSFLSTPLIVYTNRYQGLEEKMGAAKG